MDYTWVITSYVTEPGGEEKTGGDDFGDSGVRDGVNFFGEKLGHEGLDVGPLFYKVFSLGLHRIGPSLDRGFVDLRSGAVTGA